MQTIYINRERFWQYQPSVLDFSRRFHINMTSSLDVLAEYGELLDVVTVIAPRGQRPNLTVIRNRVGPYVGIDLIEPGSPEQLGLLLAERIRQGRPYTSLFIPDDTPPEEPSHPEWPYGWGRVGLHMRADGRNHPADWEIARAARIEAFKILSNAEEDAVFKAHQMNPDAPIIVRLFVDFRNREKPVTAEDFVEWVEGDFIHHHNAAKRLGITLYVEVGNENNLDMEGFGHSFLYPQAFGQFFEQAVGLMRTRFQGHCLYGWPGASPGPSIPNFRFDEREFVRQNAEYIRNADWIGVHAYWPDETQMFTQQGGLSWQFYRALFPHHLLLITEYNNASTTVTPMQKALEYLAFQQFIRTQPGVGAALAFVVSASSDFDHLTWRSERGDSLGIAEIFGGRRF